VAVAEARTRAGVVVAQHHPDRALRYGRIGDDGQTTQLFGDRLRTDVVGLEGLHLAAGHVRGLVVADGARVEPLQGQNLRHRSGEPVDVRVVDDGGAGLLRAVRQLFGLALRLTLQQPADPVLYLMRVDPHHAVHSVVAPAGLVDHRDGGERDPAAGQLLQLIHEIHDVPTG
jgi:hypothetical protein